MSVQSLDKGWLLQFHLNLHLHYKFQIPNHHFLKIMGHTMRLTEMLAQLPGTYFVTRQAVYTPALARKCKKAIRMAFENQKLNKGVSFVEVTSNCNSGWKMTPVQANKWMEENTLKYFPLGDMKVDGKFDPKFIERVGTFDQPNETIFSLRKK